MHILEIPTIFPPYGGLFCLEQAKALVRAGHEVRIISSVLLSVKASPKAYFSYPFSYYWHVMDGISILQDYPRSIPCLYRRNINCWVNSVIMLFHEYVSKYGLPDVIHAHGSNFAAVAAMRIKEEYNVPYVVTEHNSLVCFEEQRIKPGTWMAASIRESLSKAAAVIHVSEENMKAVSELLGNGYPTHVISNIIDTDFFTLPPDNIPAEPFRFCCAAVMLKGKGYDVLLKAFDILSTLTDKRIELHIAGRGTSSLKASGLKDNVVIHDHLDREGIRQMLWQSHCFVLATRSESQGLVLMEAMSCGLPYVSTEAIPASLRIAGASHIVGIDDAEAFAKAMLSVMNDYPELHAQRSLYHYSMVQLASASTFVSKFNSIIVNIKHQ